MSQAERQPAAGVVVGDEGNHQVEERDARGLVEDEARHVDEAKRNPEDGGEFVGGLERSVVGETAEKAGAERDTGHQRDREGGEGAEPGDAAEDPEELVESQGDSHQPGLCCSR